jgi:hypothetical protein
MFYVSGGDNALHYKWYDGDGDLIRSWAITYPTVSSPDTASLPRSEDLRHLTTTTHFKINSRAIGSRILHRGSISYK